MAMVDCVWNVLAHAQKPDFVFRRNGRVYLNQRGRQFSWLLAAEVCASAVVMLDTPCSEAVWRVLATHSIRHFPLHFLDRASPYAITFQLECDNIRWENDLLFLSVWVRRTENSEVSHERVVCKVIWAHVIRKRNLAPNLLSRDKSVRCHKNIQ